MRVRIFTTTIADKNGDPLEVWHWQRLDENGTNIDGSGPQRNGKSLDAVRRLVKKRFPDDVVEGLGDLA